MMGIGVGWMEEEFGLVERPFEKRGARTDEILEVVKKLISDGMIEHHGEFYDFPPVQMAPVPRRCPPILVGGHSPAALRRAAASDGWLGVNYDLETVLPIMQELRTLRRKASRESLPFDAAIALNSPPGPEELKTLEEAGVTIIVHPPILRASGERSSFEEKRDRLEAYAERFIQSPHA
jgi:alkanesulfonate monooxygenase SsuD/methylene tetrahydromethanopterin reductase-like flavin-dependent oxidoreductase (luciferase family)